ncbi:HopJ type III effector protein [Cognaticolwellia beringensis]|uniref:Type III effector n=1 Tax=Cognaticolwellia beringensis TaxID=1967665 RepID=A0A222G741_9GAMM|nr:HopJ type III effector protein [Cognaticolwellia beringensis]ASP47194.1 type III effector [Cognaticolwellia beringensis]
MNNIENSSLDDLLTSIKQAKHPIEFPQVMQVIADNYQYQPTTFTNGELVNDSGTNEGSCKIFYFAQLNNLNPQQTLACFGRYFREDVLDNPTGNDHQNIRNFMQTGWQGIEFKSVALSPIK